MSGIVVSNTLWECYEVCGVTVHVKREDLCCPYPGPQFSKLRGVYEFLVKVAPRKPVIGVLDTYHSKAGWAVAYVCRGLGLKCYNFYPVYKGESLLRLRFAQVQAYRLGAHLKPMMAGMSAVLYNIARQRLATLTNGQGIMMPNALKLQESVCATAEEVRQYTPSKLKHGTWIISVSSGTIAAGIIKGLSIHHYLTGIHIILHMGYSRSKDKLQDYVISTANVLPSSMTLIDEGYEYKDAIEIDIPFPCNPFYDAKAWAWLVKHVNELDQPIVFWNVGA